MRPSSLPGGLAKIPGWEAAGLLLLGTARFSLEDYRAAAAELQKGLEPDPEATLAPLEASLYRKILARSLLFLGRPKEADVWLQPVLMLSKDSAADRRGPLARQPICLAARPARWSQGRAEQFRKLPPGQPARS